MQSTHPISGISLEDLHDAESTTAALMRLAPRRSRTVAAAAAAVGTTTDVEEQLTLVQQALRITLTLAVMLVMSTLFATQVYFTLR